MFKKINFKEFNGKYKCWDCDEDISDRARDDELYVSSPRDTDGYRLVICRDCWEEGDK